MYETIKRNLLWFIFAIFILKFSLGMEIFTSNRYGEKGYELLIPPGWTHSKKHSTRLKSEGSYQETIVAAFVPKGQEKREEIDLDAKILVFSRKLDHAMWIEDEMPDIIASISKARMYVIDKGEIKIDEEVSQWVFFHDKVAKVLYLEFYIITENNMFFKLQYSSQDIKFKDYRPGFERLKDSFKIKLNLF